MKPTPDTNVTDTVAHAALLAAALATGLFFAAPGAHAAPAVQKMSPVVVTAPRVETARMKTIVVTASRAPQFLARRVSRGAAL